MRDERLPLGLDGETVLLREREDNGVFVGEVVVETTDRSLAASGDGGHGGGLEASLGEEAGGYVEDGGESAL